MTAPRLKGKTIWITGSARRVGRVMALACAREGADLVVHCRHSRAEGGEVVREITEMGRRAILVQGDQGRRGDVEEMIRRIGGEFGRLDVLVNSASAFPALPFEEVGEEDFFAVMRSNLYGPFLCSQLALPLLRRAEPGRIVHITDWAVTRPYRGYSHYMASKGGLDTLTRAMARELAPAIHVNAIAPGPVLEPPGLDPETRARILDRVPLGEWGSPEAVAKALLFILESDYLCGETITVDGGRTVG